MKILSSNFKSNDNLQINNYLNVVNFKLLLYSGINIIELQDKIEH